MATQRIDHRTILSDSYSPYGELPQIPDRPEPARPERRKLDLAAVRKKFGWSVDDYQEAQKFGFPDAGKRFSPSGWGWTLFWYEDQLDRWASEQRETAEMILRLVG